MNTAHSNLSLQWHQLKITSTYSKLNSWWPQPSDFNEQSVTFGHL